MQSIEFANARFLMGKWMLTLVRSRPILPYFCLPNSVLNPYLEFGVRMFQVWIGFYPVACRLLEAESHVFLRLGTTNHAGTSISLLLFLFLAFNQFQFPNLSPIFALTALPLCVGISCHYNTIIECLSDCALCQGHRLSKHFRPARQAGQTASGSRKNSMQGRAASTQGRRTLPYDP